MIIMFILGVATIISLLLELPSWVFAMIIMAALVEMWWITKICETQEEEIAVLIDNTADIVHNSLKKTEAWYEYFNSIAKNFTETELEYLHALTKPELAMLCELLQTITNNEGEDK